MAPSLFSATLVSALATFSVVQASNTTTSNFDFIVVGGGTAGLAVASRLSQYLPNNTVLVIEAGPDGRDAPGIYIPGMKGSTLGGIYDYNFTTVAQPYAGGRVWAQNRGKVLGGSSALNLMCWDRASVAEYDAWEHIGNPGWNWDSMITSML
ncbi:alcohol oxidase, partial [Aureobasidium melanogenum]